MNEIEERRSLYPRVSEIIGKQNANELRSVPLETLANACIRGTKIHTYCTAWANDLWVDEIEEEYQPYFDAFVGWATANIEETLFSSTRLYDDERCFTGEFDMIIRSKISKKIMLLDIKTSYNKSKTWPVQLAVYSHLCKINGYHVDGVMNLHLKKTHAPLYEVKEEKKVMISPPQVKAVCIEHEDVSGYWDIFSSALKCYDYFDRKEVK